MSEHQAEREEDRVVQKGLRDHSTGARILRRRYRQAASLGPWPAYRGIGMLGRPPSPFARASSIVCDRWLVGAGEVASLNAGRAGMSIKALHKQIAPRGH